MKRTDTYFILLLFISLFFHPVMSAQELPDAPAGYEYVDSVVYRSAAAVDTLLSGNDIFAVMPSLSAGGPADVFINQTEDVKTFMHRHIAANRERTMSGYRVRIFFDNRQTARVESEEALKRFERLYHDVSAYRTYANPYFKITVGDFRTKSEAVALLERIRHEFPSAFVVKENISYPVVDKDNAFVADTVKVLRLKVE